MIAGADRIVDAETGSQHTLAGFQGPRLIATQAALAGKLAFALGYDDLQAFPAVVSASFSDAVMSFRP